MLTNVKKGDKVRLIGEAFEPNEREIVYTVLEDSDYGRAKVEVDMTGVESWHLPFNPVQVFSFDWLEKVEVDPVSTDPHIGNCSFGPDLRCTVCGEGFPGYYETDYE
jgi:hypothetical protein